MVKILRYFGILFFMLSLNLFAQNINVTANTDTSDYLVGDYIYFTIEAEYDEEIRISPPVLSDKLGQLEVIKVLPVSFEKDQNAQQFNYVIAGYDSARMVIPPIPITYFIGNNSEPQTIETNEVVLFIHTLQVNLGEEIKDIKAPLRIALDWMFWLVLFLIIILLALVAYYLFKKFRKPAEEVRIIRRTPPTPIYVQALKALDQLKEKKLWQQGKVKEYHSELTGIIRKYFEDRYNFNSLEMTTAQQMLVLNRVMDNQKLIDVTGEFLTNADMVKFAKFIPLPSVNEEMLNQAYDIIQKTKKEEEQMRENNVK
jgi:hypothetical protein